MQLMTNSNTFVVDVTLGNGRQISMRVDPSEAWFDSNGLIWLFSRRYDDGVIGNFKLMPSNSTVDDVIKFTKRFIAPFGLGLAAGEIIKQSSLAKKDSLGVSLAKFLAVNFASEVVGDILDDVGDLYKRMRPPSYAYYEITTGELVITHPVRISPR